MTSMVVDMLTESACIHMSNGEQAMADKLVRYVIREIIAEAMDIVPSDMTVDNILNSLGTVYGFKPTK